MGKLSDKVRYQVQTDLLDAIQAHVRMAVNDEVQRQVDILKESGYGQDECADFHATRMCESWSGAELAQLKQEIRRAVNKIALSHKRTVGAILYRIRQNELI